MKTNYNRLALGTAQFSGKAYGVANKSGRVSRDEMSAIVEYAWSKGVNTLDTAIIYGDSELNLGRIGIDKWRVISKIPIVPEHCLDIAGWVRKSVLDSLERLNISKLDGLLIHSSKELLSPHGEILYRELDNLREENVLEKIGVSIYNTQELESIWSLFDLDLVQVPFNIIDRRLVISGWLSRLHQAGTEVHVRSIFLQGLLLMGVEDRPAIFNHWQSLWQQWHVWLNEQKQTPLQACLNFVKAETEIDRFVIGVDSLDQLKDILVGIDAQALNLAPIELMNEDDNLINPSYWSFH